MKAATTEDIHCLRKITQDDPLYDTALTVRVRLRDADAATSLAEKINQDPGRWCAYAPALFSDPGVKDEFLNQFGNALRKPYRNPWCALKHLPDETVREILRRYNDSLLTTSLAWTSLWLSNVPEALEFVQNAIRQANEANMELIFHFDHLPSRIPSERMLTTLVPVLDRFHPDRRTDLAELAIHSGFASWAKEYLPDVVYDLEQRYLFLPEAEIIKYLNAMTAAVPQGIAAVLKAGFHSVVEPRGPYIEDPMHIIQSWLGVHPQDNQIVIAAMVTAKIGAATDLVWWKALEVHDETARKAWSATEFILKRRCWQE